MPDKLTDSEIVKALRSWLEEIRKARQAYLEKVNEEHYPSMRYEYLLSDTIHEINRLQAENENCYKFIEQLKEARNLWEDKCKELQTENERLKEILNTDFIIPLESDDTSSLAIVKIDSIKAEAYKEFAERLKAIPSADKDVQEIFEERIDNLLKELVGEDK